MTSRAAAAYDSQMRIRAPGVGALLLVALLTAGCGTARHGGAEDPSLRITADPPPAPSTWPPYPDYAAVGSCWTRPFGTGSPLQAAPSVPVAQHASHTVPTEIVRRLLARFGDRRFVRSIELGPPPRLTLEHLRGYFAGARPPKNALWAYLGAPAHPSAAEEMVAQWEEDLAVGALRDDFCAAGGAPLVGWTVGRGGRGVSDRGQALDQRFPNPTPAAFRKRLQLVGRRYGFTIAALRLLRPRQLAPLVVVHTDRSRKAFVHDVPAIVNLLDPRSTTGRKTAVTFEGLFFEAKDAHGPFVRVDDVYRGETEGGEWSWSPCVYPYAHSEPTAFNPKC
ncbi:MAG TPA: hypothetical protein VFA97_00920 [Gaiellaceae bacterium]|nr:hypothetical protein [Gaiellaceae bacterium]